MPTDIRVWYTAFTYLANGITNSEGVALENTTKKLSICEVNYQISMKLCLPWIIENSKPAIC
jgi:hypothetical protein